MSETTRPCHESHAVNDGARRARAFTLLEVAMGLVLLGALLSIAVPSMGALTGARLREMTSTTQGLIRDTYARTALSGQPHRLVFDLDAQTYWVERTEEHATLKREKQSPDRQGKGGLAVLDDRLEGTEDSDDPEDIERRRLFGGPAWMQVDDELGTPQKLPPEIRFFSVWAEHLEEPVKGGVAALHFFPGGHTEDAHVTLTDDDTGDNTLTVVVQALSGETFIEREIPEVPR